MVKLKIRAVLNEVIVHGEWIVRSQIIKGELRAKEVAQFVVSRLTRKHDGGPPSERCCSR